MPPLPPPTGHWDGHRADRTVTAAAPITETLLPTPPFSHSLALESVFALFSCIFLDQDLISGYFQNRRGGKKKKNSTQLLAERRFGFVRFCRVCYVRDSKYSLWGARPSPWQGAVYFLQEKIPFSVICPHWFSTKILRPLKGVEMKGKLKLLTTGRVLERTARMERSCICNSHCSPESLRAQMWVHWSLFHREQQPGCASPSSRRATVPRGRWWQLCR